MLLRICRRSFTASARISHRKYDPSTLPDPILKRKDLEWLWRRPDPAPLPKTLSQKLDDGSLFHKFIARPPLYTFIKDPKMLDSNQADQILPPAVFDRRQGPFGPRELSAEEIEEIKRLRTSRALTPAGDEKPQQASANGKSSNDVNGEISRMPWGVRSLAEKFQCSRQQIVEICKQLPRLGPQPQRSRRNRRDMRWRWWHVKRYETAQIEYGADGNHRRFNNF